VFRSPESVVAELAYLRDHFGVNYVSFADLTFTVNREHVMALCEELAAADLGVHWMCETSIDTVDRELLRTMASCGCTKICWGIEAGDDASLEAIGKRHTLGQARQVLHWADEAGIFNWAFTMIGFPWQSGRDILDATVKLARLPIHQLRVSIATPFHGTPWFSAFPPITEKRAERFDTNHLVYRHPSISSARMKELQRLCFRKFYGSRHYSQRMDSLARRFPHLRESIGEFLGRVSDWLGAGRAATASRCAVGPSRSDLEPQGTLTATPAAARCCALDR
jgi:radical SAM superfamily enzyme YgiQ (UPF0313 family)